ncbi:MAG: alpha-1,2-fucosyltransferase [Candidatus Taylorbacteria bacterium]|nr:alpha-1,2-fucosyltransferase [Candidatus Taylorbacteria bacterium]
MLILKIKAGLGNQLFQYAYGRARALRSNTNLVIDTSWYNEIPEVDTKRTFDLHRYNIVCDVLSASESKSLQKPIQKFLRKVIGKIKRDIFGENDYTYYPKYSKKISPFSKEYIEGYFNSEKYFLDFADQIRKELTLKENLGDIAWKAETEIRQCAHENMVPILIHVRRGDYVTNVHASSFHGTKDNSYYISSIERMNTELERQGDTRKKMYILVSDDVNALKTEIVPLLGNDAYIILSRPGIQNYEEIYLMSLCSHFIIANSSFSWWGAWLSTHKNKIVIAPKVWVNNPKIKTPDVLPEGWIAV